MSYTAMRIRQARTPIARHSFVLDERLQAPLNRIKCSQCGRHVLNRTVHFELPQAELDCIAEGLWYAKEKA